MSQGYWGAVWRQFRKNRLAVAGLVAVSAFFVMALAAPLLSGSRPYIYISETKTYFPLFIDYPEFRGEDLRAEKFSGFKIFPPISYSPSEYDLDSIVIGPGAKHIMGTDEQGRDLASRMIHGTRVSIFIGFIAVFIYVSIGVIVGALAGFYGGWIDIVVSRVIEIVICFPTFFLILTILACGAQPAERHGGHRRNGLDRSCPYSTRRVPAPARGRLRGGLQGCRSARLVDNIPSHAAQLAATGAGLRHLRHRLHHPHRVITELPWIRCSASDAQLGRHTIPVAGLHGFRLVADAHPRIGYIYKP